MKLCYSLLLLVILFVCENCSSGIDYCTNDPCLNGGTCIEGNNGYTCVCPIGYTGNDCESDIDECAGVPCQNGASCSNEIPGYACICAEGYTGSNCEEEIDNCANSPCLYGSTCINLMDGYSCICGDDYTGDNCETPLGAYDGCRPTCRQSRVFDKDLCLFYCQLEEWRETMNMLGLSVPVVEELKSESAFSESRWRTAVEHYQLYYDIWVEFAENQELFFEQETPDNRNGLISEWQLDINSKQKAVEAWREYTRERNPNINFVDFQNDEITEDLTGEQLSAIYANISREWSSDLNIYKTKLR